MEWKLNGVSAEQEEVFAFIKHEIPRSSGIIIFGADSGLKAKVYELFRRKVNQALAFDRKGIAGGYVGQAKTVLKKKGRPVLVCMHGDDSVRPGLVSAMVDQLREFGAKAVVGIYVNATKHDAVNFKAITYEPGFSYQTYRKQLKKLAQDPPSAGGFDLFIEITSGK